MAETYESKWPGLRGTVKVGDRSRRDGQPMPHGYDVGRPVITWRRRGCGCRLARVYLSRSGWHVVGEHFRIPPADWLRRSGATNDDGTPVTMQDVEAGRVVVMGLREVHGVSGTLPLDVEAWPAGETFEVGCDHAYGQTALCDLAGDAATVSDTRKPLDRRVTLAAE